MALNIKNSEVENNISELSQMLHVSKVQAINIAVQALLKQCGQSSSVASDKIDDFLQEIIWPIFAGALPSTHDQLYGYLEDDYREDRPTL